MRASRWLGIVIGVLLLARAGAAPARPRAAQVARTLVYHQIRTDGASPVRFAERSVQGRYLVLAADGSRAAYVLMPERTADPEHPAQVWVIRPDGSDARVVETNAQSVPSIDLSADGERLVSCDGRFLRTVRADGTGAVLLAGGIGENGFSFLFSARVAGNGAAAYFCSLGSGMAPPYPTGVWTVGTGGGSARQLAGPSQVVALLGLSAGEVFDFRANGDPFYSLSVSRDGSRVAFGVTTRAGEYLLAVNSDGGGLHALLGPVPHVVQLALTPDGSRVFYQFATTGGSAPPEELGSVAYDGTDRRVLGPPPDPRASANDRLQLSSDGSLLFFSLTGRLLATGSGALVQLRDPITATGFQSGDGLPLVYDGLLPSAMDGTGRRFVLLSGSSTDSGRFTRLITLEIDPAAAGDAPTVRSPAVQPALAALNGSSRALLTASVSTGGTLLRVNNGALRAGSDDPYLFHRVLYDDGTHGDAAAGDGTFSASDFGIDGSLSRGPLGPFSGPRTLRVNAYSRGTDGNAHLTSVDFEPFTVVDDTPPTAPSGLSGTALSSERIRLTWQDNSASETGFHVERRRVSTAFERVAETAAGVTELEDGGLAPATEYRYRVRAFNALGASSFTPERAVGTLAAGLEAPSGLAARLGAPGAVELTWQDNSTAENGFELQRRETGGGFFLLAGFAEANSTRLTDRPVEPGHTYQYRVRAVIHDVAASPFSNEVEIAIPAGGLSVAPERLEFGTVARRRSKTLSLTLTNLGATALSGSVGRAPAPFAVTSGSGSFRLGPGKRRTVRVRFRPRAAGAFTGTLLITTGDSARPELAVPFTGTGR